MPYQEKGFPLLTEPERGSRLSSGETMWYILVSLLNEGRHGYGILRDVTRLSNNTVKLAVASLYDNLHSLEQAGLIEMAGKQGPRRKKSYQITEQGKLTLETQRIRINHMLTALESRQSEPR